MGAFLNLLAVLLLLLQNGTENSTATVNKAVISERSTVAAVDNFPGNNKSFKYHFLNKFNIQVLSKELRN